MKFFLVYLFIGIGFSILSATLLQIFAFAYSLIPDFILIMALYLGIHRKSIEGAAACFFLGFISDTFTSGVIGVASFALVFIFFVSHLLSKKMSFNVMPVKIGAGFIMALLKANIVYIILKILVFDEDVPFYVFAMPTAITTAIASPFVFNLLNRVEAMTTKRQPVFLRE